MSDALQIETNKACGGEGYTSTWRAIGFAFARWGTLESIDYAFGDRWPEGPEAIMTLDEQLALRAIGRGRSLRIAPVTSAAYIVEICYRRQHIDGKTNHLQLPRWELAEAYQIVSESSPQAGPAIPRPSTEDQA